jgi:DNA-binding NarL/FixJ family response regulator
VTRIVLADDHVVVRQGIRAILEMESDFDVVGEAADGVAALELVERFRPDVLVTDVAMPHLGGLDVASAAKKRSPATNVVVLTMHADDAYVAHALRHGVLGYVLKDSGYSELIKAVRAAAAGRLHLGPPLSEQTVESYLRRTRDAEVDIFDTLTAREREVVSLDAEGLTAAEIGARLSISPRTVEAHRAHVMAKLGLRSKAELIRYVVSRGQAGADAPRTKRG